MLPRPLSTTLILDFGIVPTVWIFYSFSFYSISGFTANLKCEIEYTFVLQINKAVIYIIK